MRILMLAQFYAPITGGEERHVQDLSIALAARGHQVAVATLGHEGCADFEIDRGVRVYRIRGTLQRAAWLFKESGRRHVPPVPDPELTWALRHVIACERPDIVHAHNWLVHSFLPLKRWSGAKLVVTLHDYSLLCAKKRLMVRGAPCDGPGIGKCLGCTRQHYGLAKGSLTVVGNWVMGAVERRAVDLFLCVSRATAAGNGLDHRCKTLQIIPNFVPDDIGLPRTDCESYAAQLPADGYLLFVGDLSREKGVDVLLAAYAGLTNAPPLVLIGRRLPDTPSLLAPNVVALDSWPHDAVMEAWRRSSMALVPSTWAEPFGIVAIEAMAYGRPVIASDIGGLRDIVVDGETGFRVVPGDPAALRQAIGRLLADPELREWMGCAGQRKVAEFRASAVVPRIEQAYRAVIGAGPE